jgi:anti-anti-sigma factor
MNITHQNVNGTYQIALSGRFTFDDNIQFRSILKEIEQKTVVSIQMNLAELEYIDSAALGMFLIARDEAQKNKKPISIIGAGGIVKKTLLLARFDSLFIMQ